MLANELATTHKAKRIMPIIPIKDPSDLRLAPYISIRERDLTRGHGARFIVEGKVTLNTLLTCSRFQPESLFLAESRIAPLKNMLEHLPDSVPIYSAPQEIMDQVAGFPVHRGVLACGIKSEPSSLEDITAKAQTLLVLIGLSNHDNVGACFRNAAAFGVDAVLLDAASCDPLYRKAIRVSAGATLTVPYAHSGSGPDIFAGLDSQGYDLWCLTPRRRAAPIHTLQRPKKLALVLGAEGPGLPEALIARGQPIRIPMVEGFDSLNVATAGGIAMSHVFNQ